MATTTAFDPYLLTPLDHIVLKVYMSYCLSFRLEDPASGLPALQAGVNRLISALPFLAGYVAESTKLDGKKNVMEVQPPTVPLETIPMLQVKYYPHHTIPPNGIHGSTTQSETTEVISLNESCSPLPFFIPPSQPKPVLRFQASIMADGIVLTMAFHHSVLDATGSAIVLEMLAQCCRTSPADIIQLPTDHEHESHSRRLIFDATAFLHEQKDHTDVYGPLESTSDHSLGPGIDIKASSASDLCIHPFVFSSERIRRIKDACNSRTFEHLHAHKHGPISSNNILTALLAICIDRARRSKLPNRTDRSQLFVAVNLRGRLQPPLPENYLGNAVTVARILLTPPSLHLKQFLENQSPSICDGIDDGDLHQIASLATNISAKVTSINDEFVRSFISYVRGHQDWSFTNTKLPDVIVSSTRHLKVYSLDFGTILGQIDGFELLQPRTLDGVCIIMPDRRRTVHTDAQTPPWDVRLTLNTTTVQYLMDDPLFCWALETGH